MIASNTVVEKNGMAILYRILVMTSLIIFPILQIYSLFGINLSSLVVGSLALVGFVFGQFKISKRNIPHFLWIYFIYFLIVTVFSGIYNAAEMPNRVAGVLFLLVQFLLFFSCSDKESFYKIYKIVAIGTMVFFYIQEIGYNAVGLRIPGIIPFLPLDQTYANMDAFGSFADYLALVGRSTSLFSEPAHFAQFLIPFLAMILFWEKGILKWLLTGITVITIFRLESGNGIVGLFCVLFMYLIYQLKKGSALARITLISILPIIVISATLYLKDSDYSKYYGERSSEVTMSSSSGEAHSGFYRIYRGYYVYAEYNPIEQLFGINNYYQIETRIRQSSVASLFPKGDMYFNVIQAFLIKTGLIGLLIYFLMFMELWKGTNFCGKSILFTFAVFSFMAALHMTSNMILYFLIPYFYILERNSKQCTYKNAGKLAN